MQATHTFVCLVALAALPAFAQQPTPHSGTHRERARTFLVVRIADALKLNDQDALKVAAVVRASDEHRQDLRRQREALEAKLRTALKKPESAADLTQLISEGNDLDQKLALVPEDTFRELQKILTVQQQAKLLLLRRDLQGEVQRAMYRRLGTGRHAAPGRTPEAGTPRPTP
jgi:hypothetical protein